MDGGSEEAAKQERSPEGGATSVSRVERRRHGTGVAYHKTQAYNKP